MKQIEKEVYGPWTLVTGASSGIGEEFARQSAANGINVVPLARREERPKEVAAELTARYDVQTRVVTVDLGRDGILDSVTQATDDLDIGLVDRIGLPAEPIAVEQAVDDALASLLANQATTITRAHMTAAFEGMRGAVLEVIKARLETAQPAH
jgi:short-subunit dehydrogenase